MGGRRQWSIGVVLETVLMPFSRKANAGNPEAVLAAIDSSAEADLNRPELMKQGMKSSNHNLSAPEAISRALFSSSNLAFKAYPSSSNS